MTFIKPKKSPLNKRYFSDVSCPLGILSIAPLSLFLITACGNDTPSEHGAFAAKEPIIIAEEQNTDNIEENIRNAHARLAAKHSDICPKLLQKNVDDETIVRSAEVMVYDYCEYYLFPEVGQSIAITINTDQIETLLSVPSVHNFANGAYQVNSYDKHVIRLNYIGVQYKPERFQYDLTMVIKD